MELKYESINLKITDFHVEIPKSFFSFSILSPLGTNDTLSFETVALSTLNRPIFPKVSRRTNNYSWWIFHLIRLRLSSFPLLIKNCHPEIYFLANESSVSQIFHSSNFHNLWRLPHHNFREYVSYRIFCPFWLIASSLRFTNFLNFWQFLWLFLNSFFL